MNQNFALHIYDNLNFYQDNVTEKNELPNTIDDNWRNMRIIKMLPVTDRQDLDTHQFLILVLVKRSIYTFLE